MNTTDKKFLFPRLYPVNRDMEKMWFIKYLTEDFTTGKLLSKKYYGSLNLIATQEERIKQGEEYMQMMQRGEDLPSYQGMKRLRDKGVPSNFANAVQCCTSYYKLREHELARLTIIQYNNRINVFAQWLRERGMQQIAIGAISEDAVRAFLLYLKNDLRLANKTYNDYKVMFGTVWEHYVKTGKIRFNPWRNIASLPNNTKHLESYPPWLRKLIKETLPKHNKQLWLFQQTIFYTGIRPHCELRQMKIKDINFERGMFIVPKELSYTEARRGVNIYQELVQQYKNAGYHEANPEHYIFTKEGVPGPVPFTARRIMREWDLYRKAVGIDPVYKLYGSKHTAGKALSVKFNSYVTKEHFRHRSIDSTEQYNDDLDKEELNFIQQDHPEF